MFWLAYAIACALLHHVLSFHYQDTCRPSWWPLGASDAYCLFVQRALQAVRAGPLLAVVPALPRVHHP